IDRSRSQLLLIFAKLFSSSKKTEPKNVSLDQLIGMDTAISPMRKIRALHQALIKQLERPNNALDDVIDMGRRLDAFIKSVKVGGAGKKPLIISIEKWTVKLIGGVGKSVTRSLKNTTNGKRKGFS
ncbi:hypothetical protein Tco_1186284, partial [Tanacetum coccineum]